MTDLERARRDEMVIDGLEEALATQTPCRENRLQRKRASLLVVREERQKLLRQRETRDVRSLLGSANDALYPVERSRSDLERNLHRHQSLRSLRRESLRIGHAQNGHSDVVACERTPLVAEVQRHTAAGDMKGFHRRRELNRKIPVLRTQERSPALPSESSHDPVFATYWPRGAVSSSVARARGRGIRSSTCSPANITR